MRAWILSLIWRTNWHVAGRGPNLQWHTWYSGQADISVRCHFLHYHFTNHPPHQVCYLALSPVFSTNVVCVKTQQKHARINIMVEPNNSIISLKIWYNGMSSFLFQNTIIPIQVTLFGMHHYSHVLHVPTDYNPYSANPAGHAWPITEFFKSCCSHNSCEGLGHASTH